MQNKNLRFSNREKNWQAELTVFQKMNIPILFMIFSLFFVTLFMGLHWQTADSQGIIVLLHARTKNFMVEHVNLQQTMLAYLRDSNLIIRWVGTRKCFITFWFVSEKPVGVVLYLRGPHE